MPSWTTASPIASPVRAKRVAWIRRSQARARLGLRRRVLVEPADHALGRAHRVRGREVAGLERADQQARRLEPALGRLELQGELVLGQRRVRLERPRGARAREPERAVEPLGAGRRVADRQRHALQRAVARPADHRPRERAPEAPAAGRRGDPHAPERRAAVLGQMDAGHPLPVAAARTPGDEHRAGTAAEHVPVARRARRVGRLGGAERPRRVAQGGQPDGAQTLALPHLDPAHVHGASVSAAASSVDGR